jgi:excisionase family DNA binding protein
MSPVEEVVRLLTVSELAGILNVSTRTIQRMIKDGAIPTVRVGVRGRRIRADVAARLVAGSEPALDPAAAALDVDELRELLAIAENVDPAQIPDFARWVNECAINVYRRTLEGHEVGVDELRELRQGMVLIGEWRLKTEGHDSWADVRRRAVGLVERLIARAEPATGFARRGRGMLVVPQHERSLR